MSTLVIALFKKNQMIRDMEKALNPGNCKNSPNKWDFVKKPGIPGHACGVPTLPDPNVRAYIVDFYQQTLSVGCSDPKECSTRGCDPYLSVFTHKRFCYPNIRKPNLENWQSDQAFVNTFIYVSYDLLNHLNLFPVTRESTLCRSGKFKA